MDIKKILNKFRKKASKKRAFNLKNIKKAKEMSPEEAAFWAQNPEMQEGDRGSLTQQVDNQIEQLKIDPNISISDEFVSTVLSDTEANLYFQNKLLSEVGISDAGSFIDNIMNRAAPVIDAPENNLQEVISQQYSTYNIVQDPYDLKERAYMAMIQHYKKDIFERNPGFDPSNPDHDNLVTGKAYQKMRVLEAKGSLLEYAMGEPKLMNKREGYSPDNRILFFLHHPEHLKGFIENDPELRELLGYQLGQVMGVDVQDSLSESGGVEDGVLRGLSQVAKSGMKSDASKVLINILNNKKALELFGYLSEKLDQLDPDVLEWTKKKSFGRQLTEKRREEKRRTDITGKEGDILDIMDTMIGDKNIKPLIEEEEIDQNLEEYEAKRGEIQKEQVEALATEYLKDDIDGIKLLRENTTQLYVDETISSYRQSPPGKEKDKYLKDYSEAEKLNVRAIISLNQIDSLLGDYQITPMVPKDREKYGDFVFLFKNKNGEFYFPSYLAQDILSTSAGEDIDDPEAMARNRQDVSRYAEYVNKYKNELKDGKKMSSFSPNWGGMINANRIADGFLAMGLVKQRIRNIWEKNASKYKTYDEAISGVQAMVEGYPAPGGMSQKQQLYQFAGLGKEDLLKNIDQPLSDNANRMIYNFIDMTVRQSQKEIDSFLDYGVKQVPKEYIEPEVHAKKQKKEEEKTKKHRHNAKAKLGYIFDPILGYIYDEVGEQSLVYKDSMIRAFYDMMCPQKRLMGQGRYGRKDNKKYPEMSNGELSRIIRREEIPEELIYLDEAVKARLSTMIEGEQGKKRLGAYNKFFQYYDAIKILKDSIKYRQQSIDSFAEKRNERLQQINRSMQAKKYKKQLIPWLKSKGLLDRQTEIEDFIDNSDRILEKDPDKVENFYFDIGSPLIRGLDNLKSEFRDAKEGSSWRELIDVDDEKNIGQKKRDFSQIPSLKEMEKVKVLSLKELKDTKSSARQRTNPWPRLSIKDLKATYDAMGQMLLKYLKQAGHQGEGKIPFAEKVEKAKESYSRMLKRLLKLSDMKKDLTKWASVESIEVLMQKEIRGYHNIFIMLLK